MKRPNSAAPRSDAKKLKSSGKVGVPAAPADAPAPVAAAEVATPAAAPAAVEEVLDAVGGSDAVATKKQQSGRGGTQ